MIQLGGTSAVAPLYAGLIALINAQLGHPIGYLNPTLYTIAAGPSTSNVFRDINDGVNNQWSGEAKPATLLRQRPRLGRLHRFRRD